MDVDFVCYSCYGSLQRGIRDDLHAALDHLDSKLKLKPGITGKRVFIGEYGFPARRYPPEATNRKSIETMIAALEWGCPFVLCRELYDNEGTLENPGGFWLINDKNEKQPIWHAHQRYFIWAKKLLADTRERSGRYPADAKFRAAALKYLRQQK